MTESDHQWSPVLTERFAIGKRLRTGRMSSIVEAVEHSSGRRVALKILHEHLLGEEAVRRRLRRELAAVRRIEHPSIVRVYDLIEDDGVLALIMEYVDGESVRRKVRRDGPFGWEEARPILDDVLAGLEEAHQQGVWHRDLNAGHVFVTDDGRGKIGGFGIARVDELVALTMHTRVLGALEAMAPERILGMDYDGRADLYSVGAVGYEMLLGHPPTDGSMGEAFSSARGAGVGPTAEVPDELEPEARYLLERALVGDVGARFATASQMRRALEGTYDEKMWSRWAARNTEYCPACESPVVDGLARCLVCDYEFERLVQNPGEGEWMVRIISPHEAFEPEIWFESNMEPKYLSEEQFSQLMQLLEAHEDTEDLADRDWEYRWPPYVLLSDLTRDDARRVARKLEARSIPCEITRELPGALQTAFQGSGRSTGVMVGIALVLITGLFTAHVNVPVPDSLAVAGFFVFVAALLASQLLLVPIKRRLGSRKDVERQRGHAFMIPTDRLRGESAAGDNVVLPKRTGRLLEKIDDAMVRREVFELLVLAVAVVDEDGERSESVAELVDEILEVGTLIDELTTETGRERTVELMDRLEQLDVRIDEACDPEDATLLRRRRRECLDDLEAHDRTVYDMTMLKARLVTVRGALLDLRAELATQEDDVVLDFEGGPEERLSRLTTYLEASAEVEAVAR